MIYRYGNQPHIVHTRGNPLDDYISLISSLRGKSVIADYLRNKHSFTDASEIEATSRAISSHLEYALILLDSGLKQPAEISFLNLYYAMLNLAKIMIHFGGKGKQLAGERWHGAFYRNDTNTRPSIIADNINIGKNGAILLLNEVIHGSRTLIQEKVINIVDIYSNILAIGYELSHITKVEDGHINIDIDIVSVSTDEHRLQFINHERPNGLTLDLGKIHAVNGFGQNPAAGNVFVSPTIRDPSRELAKERLIKSYVRRELLITGADPTTQFSCVSAYRDSQYYFSEEIAVLLAYFHLSSLVRYNPEQLELYRDSMQWMLIMGLKQNGVLTFLENFWNYVNKQDIYFVVR